MKLAMIGASVHSRSPFVIYNDDRLVYSLKDGTEITIEL